MLGLSVVPGFEVLDEPIQDGLQIRRSHYQRIEGCPVSFRVRHPAKSADGKYNLVCSGS
jgi:hypothetical protein